MIKKTNFDQSTIETFTYLDSTINGQWDHSLEILFRIFQDVKIIEKSGFAHEDQNNTPLMSS